MDQDTQKLLDEMAQLRNDVAQVRSQMQDLRTVLIGEAGVGVIHGSTLDVEQTVQQGAEAYLRGLSTSPYGESTEPERWWRLGWGLAKKVSQAKAGWR